MVTSQHYALLSTSPSLPVKLMDRNTSSSSSSSSSMQLIEAVKSGRLVGVKELVEAGCELDGVDEEGNTALHHAVSGEHYNITVLLLNSGADLTICNQAGLDCLELARSLPGRTGFSIALQLTRRNRLEQAKLEQKQELLSQHHQPQDSGEETDEDDESVPVDLSRILQTAQHNLSSAKKLVSSLESEVCSARSLVNQLELDVSRLTSDLGRRNKRPSGREKTRGNLQIADLEKCSVCLDIPKPPLKVFQCPEGHIFCEECRNRSEMTTCPECRISLDGVYIRNRTLEKLIQIHYLEY